MLNWFLLTVKLACRITVRTRVVNDWLFMLQLIDVVEVQSIIETPFCVYELLWKIKSIVSVF